MGAYNFISKIFLKGLSLVLPVAVAIYVVVWLVQSSEGAVKELLTAILPSDFYIPGMGLLAVIAIIFCAGILMYPWMTRKIIGAIDKWLRKMPIFGSVYSPVKDIMGFFGGGMSNELGQPVMLRVPNTEMDTLGFVTREDSKGLPDGFIPDDHLVVFVQWSSQIGGYCFVVPKESVRPLDISVEEGLRWSLTAGLSGPDKSKRTDSDKEKGGGLNSGQDRLP